MQTIPIIENDSYDEIYQMAIEGATEHLKSAVSNNYTISFTNNLIGSKFWLCLNIENSATITDIAACCLVLGMYLKSYHQEEELLNM